MLGFDCGALFNILVFVVLVFIVLVFVVNVSRKGVVSVKEIAPFY
jgi:hypothetical protein